MGSCGTIRDERVGATLATEVVGLAVAFDRRGGGSWIDAHPANRVREISRIGRHRHSSFHRAYYRCPAGRMWSISQHTCDHESEPRPSSARECQGRPCLSHEGPLRIGGSFPKAEIQSITLKSCAPSAVARIDTRGPGGQTGDQGPESPPEGKVSNVEAHLLIGNGAVSRPFTHGTRPPYRLESQTW